MRRFVRAALLGAALAASVLPVKADTIDLLTGPQPAADLVSILNGIIVQINASDPYVGVFKSSIYPPSTGAQFFGTGTSTVPFPLGTSADQTVGRLYGAGTNTTGYARALDTRMYFGGVGGEGEAVRAYGIVNNVTAATGGTVNGIHASLSITGANGKVSGAGHAARNTLEIASASTPGGTIDVAQFDTFMEGTVPATAAFQSFVNSGTNKLDLFMRMTNMSTTMFATAGSGATSCGVSTGAVASKVLKITVEGTAYYIPLCSTNT